MMSAFTSLTSSKAIGNIEAGQVLDANTFLSGLMDDIRINDNLPNAEDIEALSR